MGGGGGAGGYGGEVQRVKFVRRTDTAVTTPTPTPSPPAITSMQDDAPPPSGAFEIDAVVGALGLVFYNTDTASWFSTSDRKQTMAETFAVLTSALEKHGKLRFTVKEDELKINGEDHDFKTHYARAFVTHLCGLGANNFTFIQGLTVEEFGKAMDFMCKELHEIQAFGDFTEGLNQQGMEHCTSKKVLLREVSDEEVVVSKHEYVSATAEERQKIETDIVSFLSTPADTAEGQAPPAGEAPPAMAPDEDGASGISQVVQDSSKMSELIMQAVAQKQVGLPEADRNQVAKMVVECLDKAFDALLDDPFSKSQKGKKAIASALKNLEKELLTKLQATAQPEEGTQVSSAVERMTERLKMDVIVQDYSKKLKSLEESEKRILRFMKMQGLDRVKDADLKDRLGDEGVDVSGWHKLLALSGVGTTGELDETQEAQHAIEQLSGMLETLTRDAEEAKSSAETRKATPEKLSQDLKKVGSQVENMTQRAQQRINTLVDVVQADMEAVIALEKEAKAKGIGPRLSRAGLLELMGEVVQELAQPLSVIGCAIQMVGSDTLGQVTPSQVEMLNLAMESTEKMKTLVHNLGRIAGNPDTRKPDKDIQQSLYQ